MYRLRWVRGKEIINWRVCLVNSDSVSDFKASEREELIGLIIFSFLILPLIRSPPQFVTLFAKNCSTLRGKISGNLKDPPDFLTDRNTNFVQYSSFILQYTRTKSRDSRQNLKNPETALVRWLIPTLTLSTSVCEMIQVCISAFQNYISNRRNSPPG